MKSIPKIFTYLSLFLVIVALVILLSPIIIFFIIFGPLHNKILKKQYQQYLSTINGVHFFCYNNKSSSKDYIETHILPNLSDEINIIFLNGKTPISKFNQKFISYALYSIAYNIMSQKKDIKPLFDKINEFFKA